MAFISGQDTRPHSLCWGEYCYHIQVSMTFIGPRVIALPSVKYSGGVEIDVFESRHDLGGARRVASQLVEKITIDPEPCTTMLLEKL